MHLLVADRLTYKQHTSIDLVFIMTPRTEEVASIFSFLCLGSTDPATAMLPNQDEAFALLLEAEVIKNEYNNGVPTFHSSHTCCRSKSVRPSLLDFRRSEGLFLEQSPKTSFFKIHSVFSNVCLRTG